MWEHCNGILHHRNDSILLQQLEENIWTEFVQGIHTLTASTHSLFQQGLWHILAMPTDMKTAWSWRIQSSQARFICRREDDTAPLHLQWDLMHWWVGLDAWSGTVIVIPLTGALVHGHDMADPFLHGSFSTSLVNLSCHNLNHPSQSKVHGTLQFTISHNLEAVSQKHLHDRENITRMPAGEEPDDPMEWSKEIQDQLLTFCESDNVHSQFGNCMRCKKVGAFCSSHFSAGAATRGWWPSIQASLGSLYMGWLARSTRGKCLHTAPNAANRFSTPFTLGQWHCTNSPVSYGQWQGSHWFHDCLLAQQNEQELSNREWFPLPECSHKCHELTGLGTGPRAMEGSSSSQHLNSKESLKGNEVM